jgi:hypothetical protein
VALAASATWPSLHALWSTEAFAAAGALIGPPVIGFATDAAPLPGALGLVVALCALMTVLAGLVRAAPTVP